MLDHIGIEVRDLARSKAFYEVWINAPGRPVVSGAHVAFGARSLEPGTAALTQWRVSRTYRYQRAI